MRAPRLLVILAGAGALACSLHATACREEGTYLLSGRFYLDARDCLGTASTIDVVSGDGPNPCAPTCLVQKDYDGGTAVYVTSTCGPYALDLEASGTDPRCAKALAAFERNDTCQANGTSTNPPKTDAGADAGDGG